MGSGLSRLHRLHEAPRRSDEAEAEAEGLKEEHSGPLGQLESTTNPNGTYINRTHTKNPILNTIVPSSDRRSEKIINPCILPYEVPGTGNPWPMERKLKGNHPAVEN